MERVLEKCWYHHFEQLPGNVSGIYCSISRNFTKYYLHAKFQINWTIQTEITEGGQILPSLVIPICKKPALFKVKGKLRSNERAWKLQKISHHWPQCARWFSRYPISKSGIWARWAPPFCRFLASFSLKYDVTDAMLQDIEKWKCNISGVFCLICLKFCKLLEVNKRISLDFKFRCYSISNEN